MKLSQIQEARYHREHPMIDEIKQCAKDRQFYEDDIYDMNIDEVVAMLTRHFGEPRLVRTREWFWDFGNDELVVVDHPDHVGIYLA